MTKAKLSKVENLTPLGAHDVARITGDWNGRPIEAFGWVSATEHYYPPESYCPGDGSHIIQSAQPDAKPFPIPEIKCYQLHLINGAVPRAMTNAEKLAYYQSLLDDVTAVPIDITPVEGTSLV